MQEIWKSVTGGEGFYEVSNLGRVRGVARIDARGRRWKGKLLSPGVWGGGYCYVTLRINGVMSRPKVSQLVARAFIPNPENKPIAHHTDDNKSNNHVDNLEWVTYSENGLKAYESGASKSLKGENQNGAKLDTSTVLMIRSVSDSVTVSQKALGVMFGISQSQAGRIVRREHWNHV